jgi:hypothetical protein
MIGFLKHQLWAVFLAHQLLILTIAVVFLNSIRRITGRTIHGGRDPLSAIEWVAIVALSIGVIIITWGVYRWVKGDDAPSLGIAPSARRLIDLVAGLLIGFAFIISPYASALLRGTGFIHDRVSSHFGYLTVARTLGAAFFLLLISSMMEENL